MKSSTKSAFIGLVTGLGLITYFMIMKLLGLETNFYLRIFNFAIVATGVYFSINQALKDRADLTYFEGLTAGFATAATSVLVFILFLGAYVNFIDPNFIHILENAQIWGSNLDFTQAAFAIITEGIATSGIISFVWMQYFKRSLNGQIKNPVSAK